MRVAKVLVRAGGVAAGIAGAAAVAGKASTGGRIARRAARRSTREARYLAASAPGLAYRFAGRRPDPDVSDDVLADRVRSAIGPVERRLDTPRVHVLVHDHVVVLHGDVPDARAVVVVERAVSRVSGVRGVESHLHVGLIGGDTRPSESAARRPRSGMLSRLFGAAERAGAPDPAAAVHAVLCTFASAVPEGEREHILVHLPADARRVAGPARLHGEVSFRARTVDDLVRATALAGVPPAAAGGVVSAVLAVVRQQVPEEDDHVVAVLPEGLREAWLALPVA
jgi:uncharacterized protein (DUF2267 family)